jgi:hypothetical protein
VLLEKVDLCIERLVEECVVVIGNYVVSIYFRSEWISQQRVKQYEARPGDLEPWGSALRISVRHRVIVFVAQIVEASRSE